MTTPKKATKKTSKTEAPRDRYVLVRASGAGVHVGVLESASGDRVTLRDASRVWRWRGANTLHELSLRGPTRAEFTRISERVARIEIAGVCEIIDIVAPRDAFAPVWL